VNKGELAVVYSSCSCTSRRAAREPGASTAR
jgi:hypothetical protein